MWLQLCSRRSCVLVSGFRTWRMRVQGEGQEGSVMDQKDKPLDGGPPVVSLRVWLVLAAITTALATFLFTHFIRDQFADADYFFHVALSRDMAQRGWWLKAIPQFTGVGWDQWYSDKEFLYHLVTWAAYAAGGEHGVRYSSLVHVVFLCLLIGQVGGRLSGRTGYHAVWAGLLTVLPLLASERMLHRLVLVRPYLLSMLLFTASLATLLARRPRLVMAVCLAFPLAYHATFVVLLVLLVPWLPGLRSSAALKRCTSQGLLGLVIGSVIHPAFPGNILVGLQHIMVALHPVGGPQLRFGEELQPYQSHYLLYQLCFQALVVVVFCARHVFQSVEEAQPSGEEDVAWLGVVGGAFLVLTMVNPRAMEYFFPASCFALAILLRSSLLRPPLHVLALCVALLPNGIGVIRYFRDRATDPNPQQQVWEALDAIPRTPQEPNPLVFNCHWDGSPYVYYKRPDLRVVDGLDPSYLWHHNRFLHDLKQMMFDGQVLDLEAAVKVHFGASYVFCNDPALNDRLERDFRFKRLYPPLGSTAEYSVYAPIAAEHDAFVRRYDGAVGSSSGAPEGSAIAWAPLSFTLAKEGEPPYVDLAFLLGQEGSRCYWVRPRDEELARAQHAEFLGVGGGPNVRVWMNGVPYYQNRGYVLPGGIVDVLIPLPREGMKELQVLVCADNAGRAKLALSFWNKEALEKVCQERIPQWMERRESDQRWKFSPLTETRCVAPVAQPTAPRMNEQ